MSKAEPMGAARRTRGYILRGPGRRHVTPRQWRRIRHKYVRATGCYFGHWQGAKGHATPRQRKPRRDG